MFWVYGLEVINCNSTGKVTVPPSLLSGYNAPYLSVYSENAVDIFDVNSMEWIQTLPLKKVTSH